MFQSFSSEIISNIKKTFMIHSVSINKILSIHTKESRNVSYNATIKLEVI